MVINKASPHKLFSMQFGGALNRAKEAMERKDFQGKALQIKEAANLEVVLKSSSDQEQDGNVAALLTAVNAGWEEMPMEQKKQKTV